MRLMTAIMLLVGVGALQLSRGSLAVSSSSYLVAGAALVGALFLIRVVLNRTNFVAGWKNGRVIHLLPIMASGATFVGQSVWLGVPLEESVSTSLLALAGGLFVLDGWGGRHDGIVAAICVAVTLLLLPTLDFSVRGGVVAALVLSSAAWLGVDQIDPSDRQRANTAVALCAICLLLLVPLWVAHRIVRPIDLNPSYAGWVPASGGVAAESERASRGIGDGRDEISSDQAGSTGLDQNERIAESSRDSLYDLWTEAYGEPVASGEQQKTIALKQDGLIRAQSDDRHDSRTGRSFELKRKPSRERSSPGERYASILLEVNGPLPAWIVLEAFEQFDGAAWRSRNTGRSFVPVRHRGDRWMELLLRPISPAFGQSSEYAVRIGELNGRTLPLLPHAEQFRMGLIDQPAFFTSDEAGLVRLARRIVPPGATIDLRAKLVDSSRLVRVPPAMPEHSKPSLLDTANIEPDLVDWSKRMSQGQPRGWPQVLAVMKELREFARYDRSWASTRPAFETLQRAGRGNDYHFASTAVLALRSLGYPVRLVSGAFASTEHLNERTGWAELTRDNLHFWIQIRLSDGTWIDLDPTPGFPMLAVPSNWRQQLQGLAQNSVSAAARNWMTIVGSLSALMAGWLARRRLLDGVATFAVFACGATPARASRLIEFRAKLLRKGRAASMPVGTWLGTFGSLQCVRELIDATNRQLYSPDQRRVQFDATAVIKELSLKNLRRQLGDR